jgi:hypothetical protein
VPPQEGRKAKGGRILSAETDVLGGQGGVAQFLLAFPTLILDAKDAYTKLDSATKLWVAQRGRLENMRES